MAQWSNKAFDEQAGRIVGIWSSTRGQNGATLNALVEKTARDNALNPEQVARLCRVVNSRAFNQRFESMAKEGADRVVDFDTAKEDHVIDALFKTAAPSTTKTAAAYPDLADELKGLRGEDYAADAARAKVAHDLTASAREIGALLGEEPPKTQQLLHLQKVASELVGRVAWEEARERAALAKLAHAQSFLHFSRDRFEKDALATCGAPAFDVINALRAQRGLATLDVPAEKVAAVLDHVTGTASAETAHVAAAIDARAKTAQYRQAQTEVAARIAALRVEVHGAD
jgi:hypothetical protein